MLPGISRTCKSSGQLSKGILIPLFVVSCFRKNATPSTLHLSQDQPLALSALGGHANISSCSATRSGPTSLSARLAALSSLPMPLPALPGSLPDTQSAFRGFGPRESRPRRQAPPRVSVETCSFAVLAGRLREALPARPDAASRSTPAPTPR